jgi:hypothetical protein
MSHGGFRPVRNNTRGIRGQLGLEAKQVYVPVDLSAQVRLAAWRSGASQQDWMLSAVREKLQREGVPS